MLIVAEKCLLMIIQMKEWMVYMVNKKWKLYLKFMVKLGRQVQTKIHKEKEKLEIWPYKTNNTWIKYLNQRAKAKPLMNQLTSEYLIRMIKIVIIPMNLLVKVIQLVINLVVKVKKWSHLLLRVLVIREKRAEELKIKKSLI